jgi:hypothetical protein
MLLLIFESLLPVGSGLYAIQRPSFWLMEGA